ncbi:hypothetical protein JVT61DRAFT_8564 [Boletus reticuloceps]|uniref:MPN domain-containing protein n=1 Tax=Boletus reticuloceps TaxID=495285 RepID=A0A8I2YYH4_9AGAM|nr:hypothetical protein JVT61DRAFT_8564 [Boletus reticuloceps]
MIMTSSYARPSPQSSSSPRRPFCIAELANRATHNLWDPSKGLKQWLKTADGFRKAGRAYHEAGDLEAAFVEFAKAATIILEKLPSHKEYFTLLTATQRHNLGLNGQDILMHLGDIKPILVDRYERWTAQHPEEATAVRTALDAGVKMQVDSRPDRYPDHDESGWQAHEAARREAQLRREEARRDEARRANGPLYRTDALLAPRRAANVSREPSLVRRDRSDRSGSEPVTPVSGKEQERRREHERERDDTRHYQEEAKRREEEEALRRQNREHEGILRRQQEAEAASRAARRSVVPSPTYAPAHSNHTYQYAQPSPRNGEPVYEDALPPSMPLESPTRSQLLSVKGPSYPIPITTTSPAPPDAHVQYPHLMSQHQLSQVGPSSLLFIPGASKSLSAHLYPTDRLPRPSAPVPVVHQTVPPGNQYTATYSNLSRTQGAPPPPAPPLLADSERFRTASQESARIIRERASEDRVPELKTVSLPRDCLPRFLSIAALNTSRNRETCGLLLGRDQKGKYVVTTLLIPRQHSTSDTCTMDEEELVMQFTEERSLITLGWIHTHPSQSCFMSSVDLHTHSGFQRMLPESFAVVCAPKSTPNFGIFRLTDPPGLQTILKLSCQGSVPSAS